MTKMIINARESEKRIIMEKAGSIQHVYIEQPEGKSLVGNIYLGIVERVVPSLNAAFVNFGKGKKGYLHVTQVPAYLFQENKQKDVSIREVIRQGEKMIVQVQKDESDKKYYRITGNIEIASPTLVYMPFGNYVAVSKKLPQKERTRLKEWGHRYKQGSEGFIIRTNASDCHENELLDQYNQLKEKWNAIKGLAQKQKAPSALLVHDSLLDEIQSFLQLEKVDEIICDDMTIVQHVKKELKNSIPVRYYKEKENIVTHYLLQKELESLTKKMVWLKNGANIVIEQSEAFTIIDVNTAKFTGSLEKEMAVMETNRLAAIEIARQIRLRNIGGNIFIDFINVKEENDRVALIQLLKKEFEKDQERTIIYGFTALGILEISRKRAKPSLQDKLLNQCPTCYGTGFVTSPATVAFQLERELWEYKDGDYSEVIIEATEDVVAYFSGEHKEHLKRLEETLLFKITFQPISFFRPHYHIKRFEA